MNAPESDAEATGGLQGRTLCARPARWLVAHATGPPGVHPHTPAQHGHSPFACSRTRGVRQRRKKRGQKLHRVSLKVRWRLFHPLPGAVERTNGVLLGATHQLTAVEEAETALVEEGGLFQAAGALASATGEDTPPCVSTAPPAVVARPALAAEVALAVGTLGGSGAFLVGHKPGRA
jgi:hypothetical protein